MKRERTETQKETAAIGEINWYVSCAYLAEECDRIKDKGFKYEETEGKWAHFKLSEHATSKIRFFKAYYESIIRSGSG